VGAIRTLTHASDTACASNVGLSVLPKDTLTWTSGVWDRAADPLKDKDPALSLIHSSPYNKQSALQLRKNNFMYYLYSNVIICFMIELVGFEYIGTNYRTAFVIKYGLVVHGITISVVKI